MELISLFCNELDDEQLFHFQRAFDEKMACFIELGLTEKQALQAIADFIRGQINAEVAYRQEKQVING